MSFPDPAAFLHFEQQLMSEPSIRHNSVAALRGFDGKKYKDAMKIACKNVHQTTF